jgi:U3 small nucleolar RNA-associated protein 12
VTGSHDKSIRIWEKLDEPVTAQPCRETPTRLTCLSQLFLEEERERDLEQLYESGLADNLNRENLPIGSGDPTSEVPAQAETTDVSKQTTETLMAGERISEALELADGEIETHRAYEKAKEGLSEEQLAAIQPPPKNPLLAAQNLEPEAWVLKVVEGVQSAALHDALLVLPFSKIMSLTAYLNTWAQQVSPLSTTSGRSKVHHHPGVEYLPGRPYLVLPPQNTPPPDCSQSHDAHYIRTSPGALAYCAAPPKVND